jgi:hypothetical protein
MFWPLLRSLIGRGQAWVTGKAAAARARAEGWDYRELPTGHVPMQTMPRELAELLITLG